MRPDLNKLLCEHERRGSWKGYGHVRHKKGFKPNADGDNVALRESMSGKGARYAGDWKEFGEFLSPLKGQVRKYCGKRYDTFFSDLCRNFDMSRPVNAHLLVHLDQYLIPVKDLYLGDDGKVWRRMTYGENYRLNEGPKYGHGPEFYVDPRDGIIKRIKYRRRPEKAQPVTMAQVDKDHVLHLIEGTWFVFTLVDCPEIKTIYLKPEGTDLFSDYGKMVRWERLNDWQKKRYGIKTYSAIRPYDEFTHKQVEKGRYHINRRTASKKMLRDAGLRP